MDTPFAVTLQMGSSAANRTGAWRVERPVYTTSVPPCAIACPALETPQRWLYDAEDGSYEQAWRTLVGTNPFPAVMGRVCYHPCQDACNRAQLDEAVGINAVERFLGDLAIEQGWRLPSPSADTGRRVLVVGAGPAGLSAAYHLRRLGHAVTVRDGAAEAGGMMRYGIPAYRLPRDVLDAEIARVTALGVELELEHPVLDVLAEQGDRFDAVFMAVGAQLGKRAYVPAGQAARVLDAVQLLHDVAAGAAPALGRRVVVVGGGDTAVDAARTARRLGATDALIVYRRTRDRMPAHDAEVAEALEEGVTARWLSTVAHADADHVTVERMALDATGFPQPTGQLEDLESDSLVLAIGQESDLSFLRDVPDVPTDDGSVHVDASFMTARPGLFAGGDVVPADRTVTTGVGHGALAARAIDAWLRGTEPATPPAARVATYDTLNTWYFADAPHAVRPRLEAARRTSGFEEVVQGLDQQTALYEARRCMSCGTCFECDNCYGVCPDNAVIKLGPGEKYAIDLDFCKGCGICAAECPAGAIVMEPEQR